MREEKFYKDLTPYDAVLKTRLDEAFYNVWKGAKPCHLLNQRKGTFPLGVSKMYEEGMGDVKIYTVPNNNESDTIFVYKYDFIKDLIDFNITLEKSSLLRHIIQGLLFGYGLAEIEEFVTQNKKNREEDPNSYSTLKEEVINKLDIIDRDASVEERADLAVYILTDTLNRLGFNEIVDRYNKIQK